MITKLAATNPTTLACMHEDDPAAYNAAVLRFLREVRERTES